MISAVRHTGVVVRNLKKMVNFYCELGFIVDNHSKEQGNFIDQVTGLQETDLEWVKLKAPDGYLLELLQYHSHPENLEINNQKSNKLGCSHMAFTVENIEKTCELINQMGGAITNPPALSNDSKVKVAYCHDLEGVLMEIVEIV